MNWKFWTSPDYIRSVREEMEKEEREIWAEMEAEKKAKAKAEWEALPDHRKAARIEYRFFQQMARKPRQLDYSALCNMAIIQNQAFANGSCTTGFGLSPYAQMSNEVGRRMALEQAVY